MSPLSNVSHTIHLQHSLTVALAAVLLIAGGAALAAPIELPPEKTKGNISYREGGIGKYEVRADRAHLLRVGRAG